jgi:cystathionine beta-lyase/cystathionine gamma-synthase
MPSSMSFHPPIVTTADSAFQDYECSHSENPNRNALEATLASLESGGAHALAFASGSTTTATILQALGPNVHIVGIKTFTAERFGT